uniref:Sugar phosphate permease n=1 Tax=Candidatus Kentrum sp. MB TaxID=2138164 RepID=A0A450X952_9GAMM|nr:MAG: Sugar phosphate permease [Candidatus Kentron sp. MB]VFK27176.1 MAG: Sugar phosphate permease [Candidatus Kentron sp. MB]VFK75080.1 MAG: Sugar phosphate permease [Candidatus Kentron sp. MB]
MLAAWGMIPLAILITGIPAGILSDRIGIRWTIGIGLLTFGVFGAARGIASNYFLFMMSVFIFGCLIPFAYQQLPKVMGLFFHKKRLGMVVGILYAVFGLGSGIGFMFSGTLFSNLLGGWQNVLYFFGACSIVIGFFWIVTIRDSVSLRIRDAVPIPRQRTVRETIIDLVWNPDIRRLCLISFLTIGAWIGASGTLPILMKEFHGLSAQSANNIMSLATWSWVIGALILPYLSDHFRNRKQVLRFGLMAAGISLFLLCVSSPVMILFWACLWGFSGGVMPITIPLLFDVPGIDNRTGIAIGMVSGMGNLGAFAFPMVITAFILNAEPSLVVLGILCGLSGYALAGLLASGISSKPESNRIGETKV